MRVLLDTTFARRAPWSGTAVYLARISGALVASDRIELLEAANHRRRPPAGGGVGSLRNVLADVWWTTTELSRLGQRAQADVIHHPLPAYSHGTRAAQVVTVHDLAFERLPDHFDTRFRTFARVAHRRAAHAADAVICVSETTAAEVEALWRVPAARIVVARHGPGQELAVLERRDPDRGGYFLYVGDDEPRKQLGVLLEAYELYCGAVDRPLELVLAGAARAHARGVRIVERPTPERLAEIYAGAAALVHPSSYEGFGLTALEAMRAGVPVLAARAPGVLEVCGRAAYYADGGDAVQFAAAMTKIAGTGALRAELRERGRQRAQEFSWAASARAHVEAYSLAVERRRP